MAATKISTDEYLKAVNYRRTVYGLNDKSPVSDDRIVEIIKNVQLTSPSSYNTQTGRITILLGAPHKKLWTIIEDIAIPIIKQHAGEDTANFMKQRFGGFKGAYGSVSCSKSPCFRNRTNTFNVGSLLGRWCYP